MADLPIDLDPQSSLRLAVALDIEGKLPRALEALGPLAGRDVVLVGGGASERRRLEDAGSRLTDVDPLETSAGSRWPLPDGSADAVVAAWSAFRGVTAAEVAEADRVLRPGGRLLVVHDYGRDDVSRLRGDRPEYGLWSRRDGPFLTAGFRIRVLHCFWTFASLDEA
ncbi:MAG TPA: methyltransferase domain-containing protein, partial [Candidatus Limnocylindrales bacterium]|nr:methyltransferase domain-containing protein [Candidatus Limnocylindrales bacterium]